MDVGVKGISVGARLGVTQALVLCSLHITDPSRYFGESPNRIQMMRRVRRTNAAWMSTRSRRARYQGTYGCEVSSLAGLQLPTCNPGHFPGATCLASICNAKSCVDSPRADLVHRDVSAKPLSPDARCACIYEGCSHDDTFVDKRVIRRCASS